MTTNINGVGAGAKNNYIKNERQTKIVVKAGETISDIAKRCGMSVSDLVLCARLKNTKVEAGKKIILTADKVPEGRSIKALANKYKMTLDQFCKLNHIPKNYQPGKNEIFYVIIPNHQKLIPNKKDFDVKEMVDESNSNFREFTKNNLNKPSQLRET